MSEPLQTPFREHLRRHFDGMIVRLARRPPRHLNRAARRARERHMERLRGYRDRGVFPQNLRFAGRFVPHFIDAFGTRCAMAHLMEPDAPDLVEHIARERNFDRIRQLVDLPELGQWLERNGLTAAEAARIQPGYPTTPAEACVCTPPDQVYVEGVVQQDVSSVEVTFVHGKQPGLKSGDVLPIIPLGRAPAAGAVIFARYDATALGEPSLEVIAPLEGDMLLTQGVECTTATAIATAPTDLPLELFLEAASAMDVADCFATLEAYDPAWGEVDGWGSTSAASGATGGSETTTSGVGGAPVDEPGVDEGAGEDGALVAGRGCSCTLGTHPVSPLAGGLLAGVAALVLARRHGPR